MIGLAALGLMIAISAGDLATDTGRSLIVFTMQNCQPCRRWKETEYPEIHQAGVATYFVDIDTDNRWRIERVPTFWIVDRATRKVVRRFEGATPARDLIPLLTVR